LTKGSRLEKHPHTLAAFEGLKRLMITSPALATFDPECESLTVDCYSNGHSYAGALFQNSKIGVTTLMGYHSKTFSPAQMNYCVSRKELLAAVECLIFLAAILADEKGLR
jgi:hypothetical protein